MPRWLDPEDPDLLDDLEIACMDAIRGDAPGPELATRVQRACGDVLRARGCTGARVQCTSSRAGTVVRIGLPGPGNVVRELKLQLHGGL